MPRFGLEHQCLRRAPLDLVPASQDQPDLFAANRQGGQKLPPPLMDRYGRCATGFGRFRRSELGADPPAAQPLHGSLLEGDGFEL